MEINRTDCTYISNETAKRRFRDILQGWLDTYPYCQANGLKHVLLEGLGLEGKTAFIANDVKEVVGKSRSNSLCSNPILVHCDYDSFDRYPTQIDVMLFLRECLLKQGVKTPLLTRVLKEYAYRVDRSISQRLSDVPIASDSLLMALFCAVLRSQCIPVETLLDKDVIKSASNYVENLLAGHVGMDGLLKHCMDSAIATLLLPALIADVQCNNRRPGIVNSRRCPVCIALDGIGSHAGASEGSWEFGLLQQNDLFVILSARGFIINNNENYHRVDLHEGICEVKEELLHNAAFSLPRAVRDFIKRQDVSIGLARLVLATIDEGESAADDILKYCQLKKLKNSRHEPPLGNQLVHDALQIQLSHLPNDQVQALQIISWFNAVDLHWLVKRLPILQPLSRALYLDHFLPYMFVDNNEGVERWYLHNLIAFFIRVECDPYTVDCLSVLFDELTKGVAIGGEGEELTRLREAIVRLRAHGLMCAIRQSGCDWMGISVLDYDDFCITPELLNAYHEFFESAFNTLCGTGSADIQRDMILSLLEAYLVFLEAAWKMCESNRGGSLATLNVRENQTSKLCKLIFQLKENADSLVKLAGENKALIDSEVMDRCCELAATISTRAGAIYSDEYRFTGNIKRHFDALLFEVAALRQRLKLKTVSDIEGLANSFNSIAVSTYRLRGYRHSLAFHYYALKFYERISQAAKGRFLRALAATLEACAADWDYSDALKPPNVEKDELADFAVKVGNKAVVADPSRAWDAILTVAGAYYFNGNNSDCLGLLNRLYKEMTTKNALQSIYATRLLHLRARCHLTCSFSLGEKEDADKKKHLFAAYNDAARAFVIRYQAGSTHLDAKKSYKTLKEIESEFDNRSLDYPTQSDTAFSQQLTEAMNDYRTMGADGNDWGESLDEGRRLDEGLRDLLDCLLCDVFDKYERVTWESLCERIEAL